MHLSYGLMAYSAEKYLSEKIVCYFFFIKYWLCFQFYNVTLFVTYIIIKLFLINIHWKFEYIWTIMYKGGVPYVPTSRFALYFAHTIVFG